MKRELLMVPLVTLLAAVALGAAPARAGLLDVDGSVVQAWRWVVDLGVPVADAGGDRDVDVGTVVSLDGTGSSDPNGDPLTYWWTLTPPEGSAAVLDDPTAATPSFAADVAGAFSVSLVVSDGDFSSAPDHVTVRVWQTFSDDFEGAFLWSDVGAGTFQPSNDVVHGGATAGLKAAHGDPAGGSAELGFTTGTTWTLEVWLYRPPANHSAVASRVSLEDSEFNGYGVQVNHGADALRIERRSAAASTVLSATPFDPPEDAWYRVKLQRTGVDFLAVVFDAAGTPLASTATSDSVHGGATLVVVRGGRDYYVDDITVTADS